MRHWIAALIVALVSLTGSVEAAASRPHVRYREPYAKARASMIAQGYLPVRFIVRPDSVPCSTGYCRRFPEVDICSYDGPMICTFIFQHRASGRLWELLAQGEERPLALFARPANPCFFTGATIQFPDGRRLMYRRWC